MELKLVVDKDCTIKELLFNNNFSHRLVSKLLLEKKDIKINDKIYDNNFELKKGDIITIVQNELTTIKPIDKNIEIVFEDDYILVVNKPIMLATIPTRAYYNDNLSARVLNYFIKNDVNCGIHVVNRLDLMTCGLVVFAKSNYIHSLLSKVEMTKKYYCWVDGIFKEKSGSINSKIIKTDDGIKRAVSPVGKDALTLYKVVKEKEGKSFLDIELKTGRTHQIRVHMSSINHPLVGDKLYGGSSGEFYLCSYYLSFSLPINNKEYLFRIDNNFGIDNN